MIALCEPLFCGNELKYVSEAVKQGWVSTGGEYVGRFQKGIAEYLHTETAIACQSGTAGLHLALIDANVGKGDIVIVPTLTFIAAVNVVRYVNADPVFIGCDNSLCIDVEAVKDFLKHECECRGGITIHKLTGKTVKAIIAVHVFGNMCNMEELMEVHDKYGLKIIEDATEALGTYYINGKYKGRYAGTIGDYGVYSFNGNKIITTGGGGMVVTSKTASANHISYLSTQAKNDSLFYVHNEVGYNYRMTNLQAALGVAQLEKLEEYISIKKANYFYYMNELKKNDISILPFGINIRPNYWFYSLLLPNGTSTTERRDEIIKKLIEHGVSVRPIWKLNHKQKPYIDCLYFQTEKAEEYERRIINIPCSVGLSRDEQDVVIKTIIDLVKP